MGSETRTTYRYRLSVPDRDVSVREWIAVQEHLSISLRLLIKEDILRNGLSDVTCRMPDQTVRRGRPPARQSSGGDSAVQDAMDDQEPDVRFADPDRDTPAHTRKNGRKPDAKREAGTREAKPPIQTQPGKADAPPAVQAAPVRREPEPSQEPEDVQAASAFGYNPPDPAELQSGMARLAGLGTQADLNMDMLGMDEQDDE